MVSSPGDPASTQEAPYTAGPVAPTTATSPVTPISDVADYRGKTGDAHPSEAQGSEVQWVNSELHTIASTIEDLQSRLEQANARLDTASKVETTEVEIGRLFVEAQQFCDESLTKLEMKVHEILIEADTKAKQMIIEAKAEATEIRRNAQQAAFASNQTVRELQAAIAGFTRVNADLLTELGSLNNLLLPGGSGLPGHDVATDMPHPIGRD